MSYVLFTLHLNKYTKTAFKNKILDQNITLNYHYYLQDYYQHKTLDERQRVNKSVGVYK